MLARERGGPTVETGRKEEVLLEEVREREREGCVHIYIWRASSRVSSQRVLVIVRRKLTMIVVVEVEEEEEELGVGV